MAAGPVRSQLRDHRRTSPRRNGTLKRSAFLRRSWIRRTGRQLPPSTTRPSAQRGEQLIQSNLHRSELYPDAWSPAIIRDPANTEAELQKVAGAKYSYKQLDNYTDLIQRTLQGVPETSTVTRSGVLQEQIYLDYSQQRLAQYGYDPSKLKDILNAQNITLPAGSLEVGPQDLTINPSGLFPDAPAIGNVIIGVSSSNSPVYLRDLVDISRTYQSPPTFLNYLTWRDSSGQWIRSRAISLGINMRSGQQIDLFGKHVQEKLDSLKHYLPDDLVIVPTSSQPVQVKEQIDLFMDALYEAIVLVVIVSLIGFWEWRSAVLMAISIPITLAMTFGIIYMLGIDIQQVSVASLIIALGSAGRRSRGGGRFHQAHAGRGTAAHRRALAGADQDCHRHHVRDHHQHRRLSAVPDDHRHHRRIHLQPADRDDGRADCFAPGVDDVHSAAGLLPAAAGQEAGDADRGAPHHGLHRLLCDGRRSSPSSIAGRSLSARWRSWCSADFCSRS